MTLITSLSTRKQPFQDVGSEIRHVEGREQEASGHGVPLP